jgi:CheY-like chemotaxis protein
LSQRHLVLYVDCDPATVSRGVVLLRDLGHIVVATTDPELAVSIVAKEPVSMVVICESLNPDLRPEIVRKIGFIRERIPIVLLAHSHRAREYVCGELRDYEGEPLEAMLRRLLR